MKRRKLCHAKDTSDDDGATRHQVEIPSPVLQDTFAFLGADELKQLASYRRVCKGWQEAASWKWFAQLRYGKDLSQSTLHLYDGDYKNMLRDDNSLGALPTMIPPVMETLPTWPARVRGYTIVAIKFHRPTNEIRVYCKFVRQLEEQDDRRADGPWNAKFKQQAEFCGINGQWQDTDEIDATWNVEFTEQHKNEFEITKGYFSMDVSMPTQIPYSSCWIKFGYKSFYRDQLYTSSYDSEPLFEYKTDDAKGILRALKNPPPHMGKFSYTADQSPFQQE